MEKKPTLLPVITDRYTLPIYWTFKLHQVCFFFKYLNLQVEIFNSDIDLQKIKYGIGNKHTLANKGYDKNVPNYA